MQNAPTFNDKKCVWVFDGKVELSRSSTARRIDVIKYFITSILFYLNCNIHYFINQGVFGFRSVQTDQNR